MKSAVEVDLTLWHYRTKDQEVSDPAEEDSTEEDSLPAEKQNTALTITSGYPRYDSLEIMLQLVFIPHRKQ